MFCKFCFSLFAVFVLFTSSSAQADDLTQRMRIPVGDYWIGGGGGGGGGRSGGGGGGRSGGGGGGSTASSGGGAGNGGWFPMAGAAAAFPVALPPSAAGKLPQIALPATSSGGYRLPASCIDEGREPPERKTAISHVSGGAIVQKYDGQDFKEQKPLDQAIHGSDAWLRLSGLSSASAIELTPTDQNFSYRLIVPDLTIAGENASDLRSAYEGWTTNPIMLEKAKALDALRTYLASIPEVDLNLLNVLERSRRQREWEEFGGGNAGAKIPAASSTQSLKDWIDGIIADQFGVEEAVLTASHRLNWFTLLLGRKPTAEDVKFWSDRFASVDIAKSGDSSLDANLLKAFSAIAALPNVGERALNSFGRLQIAEKLNFDEAMRQASFQMHENTWTTGIAGETMWTTGQPGLLTLQNTECVGDTFADAQKSAREAEALLAARFNLMQSLGVYTSASTDTVLANVDDFEGTACLLRLTAENKLETRQLQLAALTPQFIRQNFNNSTLVVTEADSRDMLKNKGIEAYLLTDFARGLSAKAFKLKDRPEEQFFEHPNRAISSTPGLDFATLNLETKGDALVARLPDGTFLMIDTGLGKDTLSKLSGYLSRNYPNEKTPSLRLVITHSHADHIGGLRYLADAGFDIQEMIVGRSMRDGGTVDRLFRSESKAKKPIGRLAQTLAAGRTTEIKKVGIPGVTHFVKAGIFPLFDASAREVSSGGEIESWSLKSIAGTQIDIHHMIRARDPNDGGLLVRIGYKGMHWLLCDDLSDVAWTAIAKNSDDLDLRAGILKWPHHLWLPNEKEKGQREQLEEMLELINPHTIIFSNTGHASHNPERYKEIKKFVERVLPKVQTKWTHEDDKHIVQQAQN